MKSHARPRENQPVFGPPLPVEWPQTAEPEPDQTLLLHQISLRVQDLFQHVPTACFSFDSDGYVHEWNAACEALFGLTREKAIGTPVASLLTPPDSSSITVDRFIELALHGQRLEEIQWIAHLADGTRTSLLCYAIPINQPDGSVAGVVCVCFDLNEHGQEAAGSGAPPADRTSDLAVVQLVLQDEVRERKQAEDNLRRLMTSARCLVWHAIVIEEGGILKWFTTMPDEEASQRFLPLDLAPYRFYSDAFYFSRIERESCDQRAAAAVRAGEGYSQEFRCRRRDGEIRWLAEEVSVETLGPGRWRATGVCMDITERKQVEDIARSIINTARCLLWEAVVCQNENGDLVWNFRLTDEGAAQRFLPLEIEPGQTYYDAWYVSRLEEDREKMNRLSHERILAGEGYSQEFRCRRRDGQIRWLTEDVAVEPLDPGRWRAVGVCLDITDRKHAETVARSVTEAALCLLWEAEVIDDGDEKPRWILSMTDEAAAQRFLPLNMKPGQAYVDAWYESRLEEDLRRCDTTAMAALRANESYSQEFRCRRADGEIRWLTEKVTVETVAPGHWRATGVCMDVTERKNLESQLAHSQKLESIGQLAAGIAHEINTPIQYVGDNTRFLKETFGNLVSLIGTYQELFIAAEKEGLPELRDRAATAAQEADLPYLLEEIPRSIDQSLEGVNRVAAIVRAMKEFSHPGAAEKTPIDLNHALESTIAVARNEWKYVANLVTDLDPDLPQVSCLPGDLNQVFLNLIINAAQAIGQKIGTSSTEKGTITIRTHSKGDWVQIEVQDTGVGIPEAIRPRVYDQFFTTKDIGKGSGQGLSVSRMVVVDQHQGTITFESEENVGTTFIVRLPIIPPAPAVPKAA